ncbi:alpha-L-rhamnosidase [Halostagnicola kamekurae]|uniref:Alpha-L-rhamnosidase n=1 Tax=Halostagnicola kamekurae TaxID=619731 RepID=A0A1I6TM74_9EURY|nr:alpha-L-rhamnosidase [Halostagnicola kamekurae]
MSQTTTRAFRERTLSRRAIEEFARSHYRYWAGEGRLNAIYPNGDGKRDIPDFTISFPEWVWRYYRVTGDRQTLETAAPIVWAIATYGQRHVDDETGLVTNQSPIVSGRSTSPFASSAFCWVAS